ncbi:hypothetical protein B0H16DRAFT_1583835 [Mycena metata]|uniref:LysM domain-containing protein n=1 Tax=Mycena metata TaxID=1033252 RepID=A0AAD7HYC6_9AGAR|nr:hypothetical protein B0H16DRAFT_1583835 [Mycena metata]
MGRWTQHDEDSTRLPEGMERVGYDSDTGRYYFSGGGRVWQGAQGAQFSEMTRVDDAGSTSSPSHPQDEDVEAGPRRADGYQALATDANARYVKSNASAYRTLFPFFLLIGVFLLLVWRLILAPSFAAPKNPCPAHTASYLVEPGDSCWEISRTHGCTLDEFKNLNEKIDCDRLLPGSIICLPEAATTPA